MIDVVEELQGILREAVHKEVAGLIIKKKVEEFKEDYNEETKVWTFCIEFNEGDNRQLDVILDINIEEIPEEPPELPPGE